MSHGASDSPRAYSYDELSAWVDRLNVERNEAEAEVVRLREAFSEFADHDSWRCSYKTRYPWDPDCPCGLTRVCRDLGIDPPEVTDPEDPTLYHGTPELGGPS